MAHVVVIQKMVLPQPPEITGYLLRIATDPKVATPGRLIACIRCRDSIHCAPFVSMAEIERRRALFEEKHRHC